MKSIRSVNFAMNRLMKMICKVGIAALILLLIYLIFTAFFPAPEDEVLVSLGDYTNEEYYREGVWQDFTIYAKYRYENVDLINNGYFTEITQDSEGELLRHIKDFEKWVSLIREADPGHKLVRGYDYDTDIISQGDRLYIYDDPDYPEFGNYYVYFFDAETQILYYFHNNI